MTDHNQIIQNALAALKSANPYERIAALETLARHNHTNAIEQIIAATGDSHLAVQEAALWALGDLRSPGAVDVLRDFCENAHYTLNLRCAAIHSLGMIGDIDTLRLLFWIHVFDKETLLNEAAGRAILRYGDNAMTLLTDVLEQRSLSDVGVMDDAAQERAAAVRLVGALHLPVALSILGHTAQHDPSDRVRWEAIAALGKLGNPDALPVLLQRLKDDAKFGRVIVWALEAIGTEHALDVARQWRHDHHLTEQDPSHTPPSPPVW